MTLYDYWSYTKTNFSLLLIKCTRERNSSVALSSIRFKLFNTSTNQFILTPTLVITLGTKGLIRNEKWWFLKSWWNDDLWKLDGIMILMERWFLKIINLHGDLKAYHIDGSLWSGRITLATRILHSDKSPSGGGKMNEKSLKIRPSAMANFLFPIKKSTTWTRRSWSRFLRLLRSHRTRSILYLKNKLGPT